MVSVRTCAWLLLMASGAAPAARSETATEAYNVALQAYWREDFGGALEQALVVLETYPEAPEAKYARYLLDLLWQRPLSAEVRNQLQEHWQHRYPWLTLLLAVRDAEARREWNQATDWLLEFVAGATNAVAVRLGVQQLGRVAANATACQVAPGAMLTALRKMREMDLANIVTATVPFSPTWLRPESGRSDAAEHDYLLRAVRDFLGRTVLRDRAPATAAVRAEAWWLLYRWGKNLGDAENALRALLGLGDLTRGRQLTDELLAGPQSTNLYETLVDLWSDTAQPEVAFVIVGRAWRDLPGNRQGRLQHQFEYMCKRHLSNPTAPSAARVLEALPVDPRLLLTLSERFEKAGQPAIALSLLRRGYRTATETEALVLGEALFDLATRQWQHAQIETYLRERAPLPPALATRLTELLQSFGGLYLPAGTLPIPVRERPDWVRLRPNGCFVLWERVRARCRWSPCLRPPVKNWAKPR